MKKQVKVKPSSKQQQIVEEPDGSLTCLKSPATDGNNAELIKAELIKLSAKYFNVPNSVTIKTGFTSKIKWVEVDGG